MEVLDIVGLIAAAQSLERRATISLLYSGLRVPQLRLLDALDELGRATITELSRRLHVTRATTSVLVTEMIRAEILAVKENPADRRSFHVQVTELGKNKLHVAHADLGLLCSELSRRLSAETVSALNQFARATDWRGDG